MDLSYVIFKVPFWFSISPSIFSGTTVKPEGAISTNYNFEERREEI